MKNKLLTVALFTGLVACGVAITITANEGNKLALPRAGQNTIGGLLALLRVNDANANFIVPLVGSRVMTTAEYESNAGLMDGSASVINKGLGSLVDVTKSTIAAQIVVLKPATAAHLDALAKGSPAGRIRGYGLDYTNPVKQVLMYADIGGYPMFMFDPFPARMIGTPGANQPIAVMLSKWQITAQPTVVNVATVAVRDNAAARRVGASAMQNRR